MRLITFILACLCILNQSLAQNAVDDFKKVRDYFLQSEQLGFDVEVYQFENKEDDGSLLSKGQMRKSGKNYYSSFIGDVMIVNERKGTIIVDATNKEISYFPPISGEKLPPPVEIPDSIYANLHYEGMESGLKKYSFNSKDPNADIKQYYIYLNDKFQFTKVIYFYNQSNEKVDYGVYKVEIRYKNIITSGITSSFFNTEKYITVINNHPQLNKQYANYKLLN